MALVFSLSVSLLVGLVVGSFLNVCRVRIPKEESIVFPASHCPACKTPIRWFDNIPLLGFAMLRGKCRQCSAPISWRYPLLEFITGLAFVMIVLVEPNPWAWPYYFYFVAGLVLATFVDLESWIIPDLMTLPGIVIGVLGSFLLPDLVGTDHLLGAILGGGILWLVGEFYWRVKGIDGIGGGDVKFLAMAGAFLGWKGAILTLLLSSVVGSVFGVYAMVRSGKGGKAEIPFGPFLAMGMLLTYLMGDRLWAWYFGLSSLGRGMMQP